MRLVNGAMLWLTAICAAVCPLHAHDADAMAVMAQAAPVLTETRNYAIDILLVVALLGLALFAICRSSRRT